MNGNKKCIYWLLCLNFMWPRTFLFLYLVWDFSESEETNGAGNCPTQFCKDIVQKDFCEDWCCIIWGGKVPTGVTETMAGKYCLMTSYIL